MSGFQEKDINLGDINIWIFKVSRINKISTEQAQVKKRTPEHSSVEKVKNRETRKLVREHYDLGKKNEGP